MSDSINALIGAQHNASVIDSLANPPQVNMLGSISRATEAAQGVMRMRALQSQQAWGEALQQSTDPNTGAVDYSKATALAAKDPRMPMGMAGATEGASARTTEQLARAHTLLGMTYGAVGGLPENATRAQVMAVLGRLKAAGAPGVDEEMAAVPQNDADVPAYVKQMNLAASSAMDQFHTRVGTPTTINQGGQIVGTTQAPPDQGGGLRTPSGAAIPLGLTAEQWNAPVQGYRNPDTGQPEAITQGQLLQRLKLAPPGNYGVGAPPPGPAATSGATAAPAPGAPAATPTPPVLTGPRPDDEARWKASTDLYSRDKEATTNYQQRTFPLAQVWSILSSGDVTTGQGADALNRAKSFLMTAGSNLGFDMSKLANVKDYDELAKYMQQYVNAQGMSARSDQALASAITGNPSSHLNTIANTEVVKPLLAMERMKQMAMQDFEKTDGHPQNYSRFLNDWQNTHDPRAFMVDMLDKKKQIDPMLAKMTPAERARFGNTLSLVEKTPGIMSLATMPR
jgi:hypothetical protein